MSRPSYTFLQAAGVLLTGFAALILLISAISGLIASRQGQRSARSATS